MDLNACCCSLENLFNDIIYIYIYYRYIYSKPMKRPKPTMGKLLPDVKPDTFAPNRFTTSSCWLHFLMNWGNYFSLSSVRSSGLEAGSQRASREGVMYLITTGESYYPIKTCCCHEYLMFQRNIRFDSRLQGFTRDRVWSLTCWRKPVRCPPGAR